MANYLVQFVETTGQTLYAYPLQTTAGAAISLADWTSNRVLCTEASAPNLGRYSVTLSDAYAEYAVFAGASQPADWDEKLSVQLIMDNTVGLISSSVTIEVVQPVAEDGQLESPIIIGDDYLAANARAFSWTIDAITGFVAATSTCRFGGRYKTYTWSVDGEIVDNGDGTWTLSFDLSKADTIDLVAAYYDWSVDVVSASGDEVTRIRSGEKVELVEKQT
jgi:hypothetical protein